MARYIPLFSSSSGNSHYLSCKGKGLLIDSGVSCKMLMNSLSTHDIDLSAIEGILITHEHTDHVKGLSLTAKKLGVPVYATEKTLDILSYKGLIHSQTQLIPLKKGMEIAGMEIIPFDTPHDCIHSTGFRIHTGDNRIFAFATDLGHITPVVKEHLSGAHTVVLESNYDADLLRASSYPYYLKERIISNVGHLSNIECSKLCTELVEKGTTRIILAHLSKENNSPSVAFLTTCNKLMENSMREGIDFSLSIAPVVNNGEKISF